METILQLYRRWKEKSVRRAFLFVLLLLHFLRSLEFNRINSQSILKDNTFIDYPRHTWNLVASVDRKNFPLKQRKSGIIETLSRKQFAP